MKKSLLFIATLLVASSAWAQSFKVNDICYRVIGENEVAVEYGYSDFEWGETDDIVWSEFEDETAKWRTEYKIENGYAVECTEIFTFISESLARSWYEENAGDYESEIVTTYTRNRNVVTIIIEYGDNVVVEFLSTKEDILGLCESQSWSESCYHHYYYSGSVVIPSLVTFRGEEYIVTEIHRGAFRDCTGLTSVTIPSSVTKVEGGGAILKDGAFSGCTSLKNVTCLATVPPTAYADSFENYNGYLYIPCESKDDYDFASCWGSFKHVECIGSETVELTKDEVAVVPEKTEAVFSMPKNENANTYTLTIQNNGVTFCTLTFNAQGQLANIDFSTTKSYELKSDVEGFKFTVTGLSTASDYGYSFKALDNAKAVLKEYSGSFTTKNEDGTGGSVQGGGEGSEQGGQGGEGGEGGSTAVSEVSNATAVTIVNGQILVNGEAPAFVVTVSGQKIANANLKAGVYFVVVDGESVGVSVR